MGMGETSWTIEHTPRINDRVIVKGREGWWTVLHVDGATVTLAAAGSPNVRTVQHVGNIEA